MKTIREDDPGVFASMEDLYRYLGKSRKCKFIFSIKLSSLVYADTKPEDAIYCVALRKFRNRVQPDANLVWLGKFTTAPDHAVKTGEVAIVAEFIVSHSP